MIQLSSNGSTNGKLDEDWKIEFNPLWQPTEAEVVETRNKQADTDMKYIQAGVLTPEEVAISRFGGDEYSSETILIEATDRSNIGVVEEPKESNKDIGMTEFLTTTDNGHRHTVALTEDGNGSTDFLDGHSHDVINFDAGTSHGHTHRIDGLNGIRTATI